jgi:hypothetical protein
MQQNLFEQFSSQGSHDLIDDSNSNRHDTVDTHRPRRNYPLRFSDVLKWIVEDAEPETIAHKFTETNTGLKQFLEHNSASWEAIELVLVVIGNFCEKNGTVLFQHAFIKIVHILADERVFSHLTSVILNIPKSRCTNLGLKNDRFSQLIKSLTYLTTEMLTVMPALTCDYLGEKFFEDTYALKNIPSIRDMNVDDVFNLFHQKGADRLKVSYNITSRNVS